MPNFTKKAIKETFIKLLDERPLNQITVKDIVEDCGINRNSFYYHYADLPALLEEVVAEDLKESPPWRRASTRWWSPSCAGSGRCSTSTTP